MYLLAHEMDKSVPFEKVQPQWQLLYLFFWVFNIIKYRLYLKKNHGIAIILLCTLVRWKH